MAEQNKDQGRTIAGGTETGTTGQFGGSTQSTGGDAMRTGKDRSLNENAAGMAASARQYADDMTSKAKEKSRSVFAQQKDTALDQVHSVAGAIRNTAQNLHGEGQDQTARYVHMIADQLESLGGRLRNKDLDSLMRDAQNMARRSPGAFLAGSVAVGFLLSRFLKSSSERQQSYRGGWEDEDLRTANAGEAGPYAGSRTGSAAATVGADGTPGTASGTTATGTSGTGLTGSGATGSNIGGSLP